jgi:hypothetical protein
VSDSDIADERGSRAPLGADLIIPVLACCVTGYYVVSTVDLVWEAKATGILVGAILVALCLAQFARIGKQVASGGASLGLGGLIEPTVFNRQRFGLLALVMLFVLTIHWVGTTLGLFLLLIGGMWLLGVRGIRALVGVAAVTAAAVHLLLITLLDSRLPKGVLGTVLSALSGGA